MASLTFDNTTFANKTDHYIYVTFFPAPPLEIPPDKQIQNFSAHLEEIYLRDFVTKEQYYHGLENDLSLEPGSVVNIAGDHDTLYLQYSKVDNQAAEEIQLLQASHHDHIDLDIGTQPFKANPLISHVFEATDDQDGSSLSKPMYVGSRGDGGDAQVTPSAVSHHLLQTFLNGGDGEVVGTRSTDAHIHIPATRHFNTMPYNDAANQYFKAETREAHGELQEILAMLALIASTALADFDKRRGRPINRTQEPALYNKVVSDAYFQAPLSEWLAGFLSNRADGNRKVDITCQRNEVHPNFIKILSPGLGLDETSYNELDNLLTSTIRDFANGNFNVNDDINFLLTYTSIPREKLPGSDYEDIVPKLKVLYIQSSVRTFSEIVTRGKSSSTVEKVNLKFEYNTMTCTVNRRFFKHQQIRFNEYAQRVSGRSLSDISRGGGNVTVPCSYDPRYM